MVVFDVFVKDPTASHPGGWVLVTTVEARDAVHAGAVFDGSGIRTQGLEYRYRERAGSVPQPT